MTQTTESRITFLLNANGKWEHEGTTTNTEVIYTELAKDLIRKDLKYNIYKSMRNESNGDGTRTITFYMDGVKVVYRIRW